MGVENPEYPKTNVQPHSIGEHNFGLNLGPEAVHAYYGDREQTVYVDTEHVPVIDIAIDFVSSSSPGSVTKIRQRDFESYGRQVSLVGMETLTHDDHVRFDRHFSQAMGTYLRRRGYGEPHEEALRMAGLVLEEEASKAAERDKKYAHSPREI